MYRHSVVPVLETVLPRLTGATAISSWTLDPYALSVVVAAAGLYAHGVRRAAHAGQHWPVGRTVAFFGLGLGTVVLATMSMFVVYARVLFWPATTANIMLDLVAPLGVALGDPIGLARVSLTLRGRARMERTMVSRFVRFWTFPLVSSAAVLASELSIYFTPYFSAALAHEVVWQLMHLQLLATGMLFVIPVLGAAELLPRWCTPGVRVPLVFLDGLFDSLPGILIMVSPALLAGGWYTAHPRNWGPSPRFDQQLAGGLLFTLAELVSLPFLVAVFVGWWRSERTATAELDARLDAAEAAAVGSAQDKDALSRPWWEADTPERSWPPPSSG